MPITDAMGKKILKGLQSFIKEAEEGGYMLISQGEFFVQVSGDKSSPELFMEAVSNAHLLAKDQLPEDKVKQIFALGVTDEPTSHNYFAKFPKDAVSVEKMATVIAGILTIYGCNPNRVEVDIQ